MQRNTMLVIAGVLIVLGMLFFRDGLTGMLIFDWKDSCRVNQDCRPDQVCCLFYQESYGVCDAADSCPFISDMSKVERETLGLAGTVGTNPLLEAPVRIQRAQGANTALFFLGIVLIIIVIYYYARFAQRQKRKHLKQRRR
ncbi:MAG TPA: hypothetical protein VJC16_04250 [Candidatus Nanoarchaeia archaeon]|nr:hypothetical protein [Candidatus Nanoarchaeia archaeon]